MPIRFFSQFVPWFIFFIFIGYEELELQVGAVTSLVLFLVIRAHAFKERRAFDIGSLIFFALMSVLFVFFYVPWLEDYVDSLAGITLATITWVSWLQGKPFTSEYTRICLEKEFWPTRLFRQLDNRLTFIWGIAFSIITILLIINRFLPIDNIWLDEIVPLVISMMAAIITFWFPEWYKRHNLGVVGVPTLRGLSDIHYLETERASISYRTLGQGKTIILLPNYNMTMYGWDPHMLEKLSQEYRLILLDYPGVGESKWKVAPHSLLDFSETLHQFIDALNVRQTIALGFTMGAWIAQQLAIHYPKSVQGLVLIASDVGGQRAVQPKTQLASLLSDTEGTLIEQTERFLEALFPSDVIASHREKMIDISHTAALVRYLPKETVTQQLELAKKWFTGEGTYNRLSQIEQPTLVVTGNLDKIVHRQNSVLLTNGIYDSKLLEYPNAGHGVMYQHAQAIAQEVIEYFGSRLD